MNPHDIIAQRGNAVMLHTSTDRADLFLWLDAALKLYSDLHAHVDTWEFDGPLYACTVVLTPKKPNHAPALLAALSALMDSQKGLNLETWKQATEQARRVVVAARGQEAS
jgi:hypothetical protein